MSFLTLFVILASLFGVCYCSDKEDIPLSYPLIALNAESAPETPGAPLCPRNQPGWFLACKEYKTFPTKRNLAKATDIAKVVIEAASDIADVAEIIAPLLPVPFSAIIHVVDDALDEAVIQIIAVNKAAHDQ